MTTATEYDLPVIINLYGDNTALTLEQVKDLPRDEREHLAESALLLACEVVKQDAPDLTHSGSFGRRGGIDYRIALKHFPLPMERLQAIRLASESPQARLTVQDGELRQVMSTRSQIVEINEHGIDVLAEDSIDRTQILHMLSY